MKYIRKFATRRELADLERSLDRYNWFILQDYGTTAPSGFVEVTTGDNKNSYTSISEITDDILATTSVIYFKAGSRYYRRIPTHMLWMVDAYRKDDSVGTPLNRAIVGYYSPASIAAGGAGDFLLEDFNQDFLVPIMGTGYTWLSLGSTAPTGFVEVTGQNTCTNISEVTPAVQDDYRYMKAGSTYYEKVAS